MPVPPSWPSGTRPRRARQLAPPPQPLDRETRPSSRDPGTLAGIACATTFRALPRRLDGPRTPTSWSALRPDRQLLQALPGPVVGRPRRSRGARQPHRRVPRRGRGAVAAHRVPDPRRRRATPTWPTPRRWPRARRHRAAGRAAAAGPRATSTRPRVCRGPHARCAEATEAFEAVAFAGTAFGDDVVDHYPTSSGPRSPPPTPR